ncbi:Clp protease ClpP [Aquitalea sp. S1-19]|nr:Clp protease ClpP [Aquitalea sp. S1-19]
MPKKHSPPLPENTEDEPEASAVVAYQRFESQITLRQISYYLSGEIVEPCHYSEMFYALRTATENDVIFLHLNTPGGDFDTGLQIINNLLATRARVVTILEARAYSMGALLFLVGDELIVHDNCQLMFHNYTSALIGKGNEQQAQVFAIGKWFEKVMQNICKPFLTVSELSRILRGEDIWMESDEIRRRLNRMNQNDKQASPKGKARKALPSD